MREPIAIIGTACRFAGHATSTSRLWNLLKNPIDLSRPVPSGRFNIDAFHHPDGEYHGTSNSSKGYWLEEDHRLFDAAFFNITPKEAEAVDPQQRLLLEVVYEALESAGYTLQDYAGKSVSVFAGAMTSDFDTISLRDPMTLSQYYATGNARSIMSNRISYYFDFRGPSVTIDTACSSSMVALHQAISTLRSGESPMACVTGVNLMLIPEPFIAESSLHMLSVEGHSRMWDSQADGYARGEGVAAILIKTLSQALADGDDIISIVRDVGVNVDGRTNGLTMPSPAAQADLIRSTYVKAGLDPRNPLHRCQFFEAHGTGTPTGDPREAEAIHEAFFGGEIKVEAGTPDPGESWLEGVDSAVGSSVGEGEDSYEQELLVGSIKTIIGHTEGAAGLAGLLKVVLAMHHGLVPPNLHFVDLNPAVRPFYSMLRIPIQTETWPTPPPGQPRRASVNSFGFGGANAHAIVEMYDPSIHDRLVNAPPDLGDPLPIAQGKIPELSPQNIMHLPLLLSARSPKSLGSLVEKYRDYLLNHVDVAYQQVAWQAYCRRSSLTYRVSFTGDSTASIVTAMQATLRLAQKQPSSASAVFKRVQKATEAPRLLGVFTGQGAQWLTMSKGLLETNTVYRDCIAAQDKVLESLPQPPAWTLHDLIMGYLGEELVHTAAVAQPLCTALQVALVDLLHSVGIKFACVVGHSSGEIAAAYTAGRLTLRDSILISFFRGQEAHKATGPRGESGGMLAVGLTKTEALSLCSRDEYKGRVNIGCSTAPAVVTLSGCRDTLTVIKDRLVTAGKFARMIKVDTAYHSPHMSVPARSYADSLRAHGISPLERQAGAPSWVSTVNGRDHPETSTLAGSYWRDNMIQTVLFYEGVTTALQDFGPFDCAIEIGPHPALKGPVSATVKNLGTHSHLPYISPLDRQNDDRVAFASFLGALWSQFGQSSVDLRSFVDKSCHSQPHLHQAPICRDLPSYPWDHSQAYWKESRLSRQYNHRTSPPHELLGVRTSDDTPFERRWRNVLRLEKIPWIAGHKFQGQALLPASAYIVMALDAAKTVADGKEDVISLIEIEKIEFHSGIALDFNMTGIETLFTLTVDVDQSDGHFIDAAFQLCSGPADGSSLFKRNCTGRVRVELGKLLLGSSIEDGVEDNQSVFPCRPAFVEDSSGTLSANVSDFYKMMKQLDLEYSGPFMSLSKLSRRLDFATARLPRYHEMDTTKLNVSPASLDACLHTCFAAYSAPGDGALRTAYLPSKIGRVRFNLSNSARRVTGQRARDELIADVHITSIQQITPTSPSEIVSDVLVYNDDQQMEIHIEDLVISSFAPTRPSDDTELYLVTALEVDPEVAIIKAPSLQQHPDNVLTESCERVLSFYRRIPKDTRGDAHPLFSALGVQRQVSLDSPWQPESQPSLEAFIQGSPFSRALQTLRYLAQETPETLSDSMGIILDQAQRLHRAQLHLARVTQQISHRYPRMNILSLLDQSFGLLEFALDGLRESFSTIVVGNGSEDSFHLSLNNYNRRGKILHKLFDFEKDSQEQGNQFDLVIISSTELQGDPASRLEQIRQKMRPGSFLILVHIPETLLAADWQHKTDQGWTSHLNKVSFDFLATLGFSSSMENADQDLGSGISFIIRETNSPLKVMLNEPFTETQQDTFQGSVLICRGDSEPPEDENGLLYKLRELLHAKFSTVVDVSRAELAEMTSENLLCFNSVIMLADLGRTPFLTSINRQELDALKVIMRPTARILWVTVAALQGAPASAASYGFVRALKTEVPGIDSLRMLDLDVVDGTSARFIAEELCRLHVEGRFSDESTVLWVKESEVYIQDGSRVIPRVVPHGPANDRLNATRRVLENQANVLSERVEFSMAASTQSGARLLHCHSEVHQANITSPSPTQAQAVRLQVDYSFVGMRDAGTRQFALLAGWELRTHRRFICVSPNHASRVEIPQALALTIPEGMDDVHLLAAAIRFILALGLRDNGILRKTNQKLLLLDADNLAAKCFQHVFQCDQAGQESVVIATSEKAVAAQHPDRVYLRRNCSPRELKAILPTNVAAVLDFRHAGRMTTKSEKHLQASLRGCAEYIQVKDIIGSFDGRALFSKAYEFAIQTQDCLGLKSAAHEFSVALLSEALKERQSFHPLEIFDWRSERNISYPVSTKVLHPGQISAAKTYIFFGLTRDFGQSLSRLFVAHGARNLVLASRNPDSSPGWIADLELSAGVRILVEKVDVTDIGSIKALQQRLSTTMPVVGGIVNGAMVLQDRLFGQMDLETWHSVLRPKTLGSSNLDQLFDGPDLDFFIMTSSFVAIGGHVGQTNYAAANMYMNGVALQRRRRGLPAMALNIGVIYGLGFLHRDMQQLYENLEREGFPPISERDLHHMFLEAIAASHLGLGETATGGKSEPAFSHPQVIMDFTSGLRRFQPDQKGLHGWQRDPRFSHYTVPEDGDNYGNDDVHQPDQVQDIRQLLKDALLKGTAIDAAEEVMLPAMLRCLERILQSPFDSIDAGSSLAELGVDSLASTEIRRWIYDQTGRDISVMKILRAVSVSKPLPIMFYEADSEY
ncbi:hypothetical protein ACHAQH_007901 [Verticillium albo-atrum]